MAAGFPKNLSASTCYIQQYCTLHALLLTPKLRHLHAVTRSSCDTDLRARLRCGTFVRYFVKGISQSPYAKHLRCGTAILSTATLQHRTFGGVHYTCSSATCLVKPSTSTSFRRLTPQPRGGPQLCQRSKQPSMWTTQTTWPRLCRVYGHG